MELCAALTLFYTGQGEWLLLLQGEFITMAGFLLQLPFFYREWSFVPKSSVCTWTFHHLLRCLRRKKPRAPVLAFLCSAGSWVAAAPPPPLFCHGLELSLHQPCTPACLEVQWFQLQLELEQLIHHPWNFPHSCHSSLLLLRVLLGHCDQLSYII